MAFTLDGRPCTETARLSWDTPAGGTPDTFTLYVDGVSTVTGIAGALRTYRHTGLDNGVTYAFEMRAVVGGSETESSNSVDVTPALSTTYFEPYLMGGSGAAQETPPDADPLNLLLMGA